MQTKSDQPWYTKSQTQTKSTNHKGMRSSRQKYKNTSKRPNKTQTTGSQKHPKSTPCWQTLHM
jgi:hypothetical protein